MKDQSLAGYEKSLLSPCRRSGHGSKSPQGMAHSGGDLRTTVEEWRRMGVDVCVLDASGDPLEGIRGNHGSFGFILGDDRLSTA